MKPGMTIAVAGALALIMMAGAQPVSAQSWERICGEGETCPVVGTKPIRFGAEGQFVYGVATRWIVCNRDIYGDPAIGVIKACEAYYTPEELATRNEFAQRDQRIRALEEEARTLQAELDEVQAENQDLRRVLRRAERRDRGGLRLEVVPRYRDAQ